MGIVPLQDTREATPTLKGRYFVIVMMQDVIEVHIISQLRGEVIVDGQGVIQDFKVGEIRKVTGKFG